MVTADQWGIPERDAEGRPICRWCRGPVERPRRTFCSEPCVHEWKIRSSPWYVRREVKKRDKGICRLCGLDVLKAHREWGRRKPPASDRAARRQWRAERPRWEADHIVPVADGGGESILEAIDLESRYQISFWDALVVQAAQASGVETLYSEDLSDGQTYGSVKVINPLRAGS